MVAATKKNDPASKTEEEIATLLRNDFKWCSVKLSDVITAGKRLEAAVFDIEGRQAREAIENCKMEKVPLSKIFLKAYYPGRFKRIYSTSKSGIPFYLPSQMTDVFPKPEKYISRLTKCDLDDLRLKANDLLLTRSGTVGKIALVSRTLENSVFSDDIIRTTFPRNEVGYLYAYLSSSIGNTLLATNKYGSVINHIEPEHLDDIPVPNPPEEIKKHINDLILRSFELRDKSNELIDNATKMLVSELKLPPIDEIKTKRFDGTCETNNFCVKLSQMNNRADASYHVPIVASIVELLKKNAAEITTVGDKRVSKKIILAGIFKRTYVEKGYGIPFLGGKEITQLAPSVEKFLAISRHKPRYEKELKVQENMILVTDRGSIGTVAIVPKHFNGYAVSQNVLKIIPANDEIAGYLYIYLSSHWGNLIVKKETYGSVVDMIDNNSLCNVVIPLLKDKKIQTEINNLALKANKLRYEAYLLEQQAIKSVEQDVVYA